MKNKLLIVADLGLIKTYRVGETERNTPHLELLDERAFEEAHRRFAGIVTDAAGQHSAPTQRNWGAPMIDDHNLRLEIRRRLIRQIAEHMERMVRDHEPEGLWFGAHSEINRQVLDALSPHVRAMIEKNIPSDLIKAEQKALLRHFLKGTPAASPVPEAGG